MTIHFILLINKRGQTRFSRYFTRNIVCFEGRMSFEGELARRCLRKAFQPKQCTFYEMDALLIVFRRYMDLFFIVGVDFSENELSIFALISCLVERLSSLFNNVCELDVMFNLEKLHFLCEELVSNQQAIDHTKSFFY